MNPGSFADFEGRLKANGWGKFSTNPHIEHWGDDDYRKQYKGEWYHFSMTRPVTTIGLGDTVGFVTDPNLPPEGFSIHWEEAKPGSAQHLTNFLWSKFTGIPIWKFRSSSCMGSIVVGGSK